jgi:predicted phosphodiesterase
MEKKRLEEKTGEPIFRYGIITATHCRPEEGDESSPWEVNKLANDRARWIVDRLNAEKLDLVIHMGDIVHPLPHLSSYGTAAEAALKIFDGSKAPFYLLPGNHDIGDKHNPTMPAYLVDNHGLSQYAEWFGPPYQSFDHGDIHFVLINSPALNSGLTHEAEQARWLEADLEENKEKRIHVFSHYPPYILEPGEPSNYDNIDEPARSWLLGLLEEHHVEALFAGHVHQFIYQRHGSTDVYNLLATSFVRQDYSEMFRIEAAADHGRDDGEKLGWCTVEVHEDGHIARVLRSGGSTRRSGEKAPPEPTRVSAPHTKERLRTPIGVHLRHPWAEIVDLPYNGPIDEFNRKRARNDYTLLGLWETGITNLRVPMSDLMDARVRRRMRALKGMGLRFHVFNFGVPSGKALEAVREHQNILDSLEIVLPWREAGDAIPDLIRFRETAAVPLLLANVMSSADQRSEGSKFSHYMSYGFHRGHPESLEAFLGLTGADEAADGFVFRIGADESPWDSIQAIGEYATKKGLRAIANVRLASERPAEYLDDDVRVANRASEALVAASATPNVEAYLDTFVDLDRGYFPRVGLYDRRCNRRLGSHVLANLQGALRDHGPAIKLRVYREEADGKVCVFESGTAFFNLLLPSPGKTLKREIAHRGDAELDGKGKASLVDLSSGIISEVPWKKAELELSLSEPIQCRTPFLLILEK